MMDDMDGKNVDNCKTVQWILLSLNLCDYTHVCIRIHTPGGVVPLGGGYPHEIIRRYGQRLVVDSCTTREGALVLYVQPEDGDIWAPSQARWRVPHDV